MADKDKELFGFEITQSKDDKLIKSPIPTVSDDGTELPAAGFQGHTYELYAKARNEAELVSTYRDTSLYPEADAAIDDVMNEFMVHDYYKSPVTIRLDQLNINDQIKTKIREEFQYALQLLNFSKKSYDITRKWYVDGRIYFQILIDEKKPKEGILELRPIDAIKIKFMREPEYEKDSRTGTNVLKNVNEYFIFKPDNNSENHIKFAKDAIVYNPSGITDRNKGMTIGHLDKAIKPFNNLRTMEDSMVIYRIARAPERRIFYIDVGQMPKIKAEQYLRDTMNRYRNKIEYNPATGEVRDQRKHMSVLEDFWLPRRDGSRGTEITTLPGGQQLGEIDDVLYFKQQLYKALNVPVSRLEQDQNFQLGRASEISRDELKFSKFVARLRRNFSELFNEILKSQLVLKGICTVKEYDIMKQYITYEYEQDQHFKELKDTEILTDKMQILEQMSAYVGKYWSVTYVRKHILRQSEDEIARIDREIMQEIEDGIIKGEEDFAQPFEAAAPIELPPIVEDIEDPEFDHLIEHMKEEIDK